MLRQEKKLSFDGPSGRSFLLRVQRDPIGALDLKLTDHGKVVQELSGKPLVFLYYLAERAGQQLRTDDILDDLWPDSGPNVVEKYISVVRKALGDTEPPFFIETIRSDGYKFLRPVTRVGDLGEVDAYPEWSNDRFFRLLERVHRGPDEANEDIRIVTTHFSCGLHELKLDRLVETRDLRIRVLMIDGESPLTEARYLHRQDIKYPVLMHDLQEQTIQMKRLAEKYRRHPDKPDRGFLEFHVSDMMPCGIVVHTPQVALMGVFLAHESYIKGPMIEIRGGSDPWKVLYTDWQVRWDEAERKTANKPISREPL